MQSVMEALWMIGALAAIVGVVGVWLMFRMVRTAVRLAKASILVLVPVLLVVAAAFYGQ